MKYDHGLIQEEMSTQGQFVEGINFTLILLRRGIRRSAVGRCQDKRSRVVDRAAVIAVVGNIPRQELLWVEGFGALRYDICAGDLDAIG